MIRFILYLILFYLIFRLAKKVLGFFSTSSSRVEGSSVRKEKKFDPENIEDVDYEEIKRKK